MTFITTMCRHNIILAAQIIYNTHHTTPHIVYKCILHTIQMHIRMKTHYFSYVAAATITPLKSAWEINRKCYMHSVTINVNCLIHCCGDSLPMSFCVLTHYICYIVFIIVQLTCHFIVSFMWIFYKWDAVCREICKIVWHFIYGSG